MNKKILLGSIIAVVILVLVSFTGVVGYQTTKSSTIARASPLFSVRSKRAIDEESKDLTCDYVGKGEDISIPLPIRDSRNVFLQKFIDRVSKMNEETCDKYINELFNRLIQEDKIRDSYINRLVTEINQLKINSEKLMNYLFDEKLDPPFFTMFWFSGCILFYVLMVIPTIILYPLFIYCLNHPNSKTVFP